MEKKKEKRLKKNKIPKRDLSQSAVLEPIKQLDPPNIEVPDYIDDFLQISPDAVFINGNNKKTPKKKIIIKKIIKVKINKNNKEKDKDKEKVKEKDKEKEKDKDKEENKNQANKEKTESEKVKTKEEEKEKPKENNYNENTLPDKGKLNIDEKNKEENKVLSNTNNNLINNSKDKIEKKEEIKDQKNIRKKSKKQINKTNDKIKLKEESEQDKEKRLESYKKINSLVITKIIYELFNILKNIYFFIELKKCHLKSATKIQSAYLGYIYRQNLKLNYLTQKIIEYRKLCISKIIAYIKGYIIRKYSKAILQKKEDYYIIYSSLSNNKTLYFKVKYNEILEDNIYFEYCKLLKCFIYYVNRKGTTYSKKKVSGFFYNEKYKKLVDDLYEKNEKGENIINFPEILKKTDINSEKYDKIINEYIKAHRPVKRKRENIIEYEERKKKALDDDMLLNKEKFEEKIVKMKRSRSFIKLKGVMKNKGILKPSKSYINLKSVDKKIQFGKAKIKKYHLTKK